MEIRTLAIIFFISIVILTGLLIQVTQTKAKNTEDIATQLLLALLMNAAFVMSLFVEDVMTLKILYTLVLILEVWILYLFLRYTNTRTILWKRNPEKYRGVVKKVIIVDNLFLVYNIFTEKLFRFLPVKTELDEYVTPEWSWFFILHFSGCILLMICLVLAMIRKTLGVAKIYRSRYQVCSIGFAAGAVSSVISRIVTDNMNIGSVFILSIGVVCFWGMYYLYPMYRAMRMKTYAINRMDDPVLMFDYNNHLQVYNLAAVELLGVYSYYRMEDYIKENELYYTLESRSRKRDKDRSFTRTKFLNAKTYLIHGQELWDENDKFVGTLIVYTDITGQEKLKDEATLYATRDQLTGLWNRDYFFEMANKTILENPSEEFLMVATDIYHFKLFNEILGTEMGDDLLLAFAQVYRENYKRLWVFSRIAGDRFALLIPKKDFKEDVFLNVVHEVLERKHYSMKVHCYIGVYEIVDKSINAESMYDRAFMALESIKGNMQKEVAYYHEEILSQRLYETNTLDELDRALLNDEFVIFLQPQVNIQKNEVVSAEALIRWDKPGRGIVPPGEFIPIFENNGMIAKLDYYVWELACRQLRKWKELGYADRSISVNISAKDFYMSDLYESITSLVEKYEIAPVNLRLEITESAFVLDVKKQMELVHKLQAYGFIIEIDDFGSGYSTLNALKDIMVDVLKMDLKFFEKSENRVRAQKIVHSIIALANELNMPVIAEGVETLEDVKMLKEAGCQMIQGYFFAKPMSVAEYEQFVDEYACNPIKQVIDELDNNEK